MSDKPIDRITDILYKMKDKTSIRFVVTLNKPDKDKNVKSFHYENEYPSSKYGGTKVKSITRDFTYYIVFQKHNNALGIIKPENMIRLRKCLNKALEWFEKEEYSGLFIIKNNTLIVDRKIKVDKLIVPLSLDTGIMEIYPAVVRDSNDSITMGVNLKFNKIIVELTLEDLNAIAYIIGDFNMYESASLAINYRGMPPDDEKLIKEPEIIEEPVVNENVQGYSTVKKVNNKPKKVNNIFDM